MPTYSKKLKRTKNGVVRYIGRNFKQSNEKFYLGWDIKEAEQREKLILELWDHLERHWHYTDRLPYWTKDHLKAAKAIAKGQRPVLPPTWTLKSHPEKYVASVNQVSRDFQPADQELYDEGLSALSLKIQESRNTLAVRDNPELTGRTIREALEAYRDHLMSIATQPDGSIKPWGKTQLTQLKSWTDFLAGATHFKDGANAKREMLDIDIALLTNAQCQAMIDIVRSRPLTFDSLRRKSGKRTRLTISSAKGIIKLGTNFFDWLDLSDDFQWFYPRRFRLAKKSEPLDSDEKFRKAQKKEASTLPYEHIQQLSEYALPSERVILLCGLNAAFGPGEIGQLRVPFIRKDTMEISGIRFKTGNATRHRLWQQTLDGLEWQLEQRKRLRKIDDDQQEIVFLTNNGQPLWRRTKAGNYSDGVGRRWSRLIERVQRDDPTFPHYSLGKLRKTAATRILMLAGPAEASLILAHKTLSEDELLECYVKLPWEKLYKAQERFGEELAPYLETDRPPFQPAPKNYIGKKKIERIRQLHLDGFSARQIAEAVSVSKMTVYRQIKIFNCE